jgi:hypothetical protein
MAKFGKD